MTTSQIRQLTDLYRTHLVGNAVGNGWINRVLGDVAAGAQIVVFGRVSC